MSEELKELLIDLVRALDPTPDELSSHLERLDRTGAELPSDWRRFPEALRQLEREGRITLRDGAWEFVVGRRERGSQGSLFND